MLRCILRKESMEEHSGKSSVLNNKSQVTKRNIWNETGIGLQSDEKTGKH